MKNKKKSFLYYLYCALGEKSHPNCNKTADKVAFIRLLITLQILITNFFIIYGVIRTHHFAKPKVIYYEVPSNLYKDQEKSKVQASCNFL
jgi:hypothetical protein